MNAPETRRLSETTSSAAGMTLFLLFTVCCLVMISVAAAAYGRVSEGYDETFSSAAAVRYVTNKLRACDSAEVLSDRSLLLENNGYCTIIYYKNGVIYERIFSREQTPATEGGEEIFSVESLSITENDGLITVTAADGENSFSACCRSKHGVQIQ